MFPEHEKGVPKTESRNSLHALPTVLLLFNCFTVRSRSIIRMFSERMGHAGNSLSGLSTILLLLLFNCVTVRSRSIIRMFSERTVRRMGHAVAHLVETLRYKSEGRGFDSRWCHWNFSLT